MAAGNTYVALATYTANGSTTFYDFSSISQAYTDLVLVIGGSTGDSSPFLRFNSDSSLLYSNTRLTGNGSAASSGRTSRGGGSPNDTRLEVGVGSSSEQVTNIYHIMNYSNTTTQKTVLCRANQASSYVVAYAGLWGSTAAISAIRLGNTNSNPYTSGTVMSLYGIAAA